MTFNSSTTINNATTSPGNGLSFHASFFNQKKILLEEKIEAQMTSINLQDPALCAEPSNHFSIWKSELESATLYRLEVLVLKVISYCIKYFSTNYTHIDDLLDCNSLATRLISNYSQLMEPSLLEYPVFKEECLNQRNEWLKLVGCRLVVAQKLLKDFRESLTESNQADSSQQYQKLPEWLKGSIKELVLTKCPIEGPIENCFHVLLERNAAFPCLMDQFLEVFDAQVRNYSLLTSSSDEGYKKNLVRTIDGNDEVVDHFLKQRVSSDKDTLFDAGIDQVLKKIPERVMQEPIKVTMVGVEYTGLCKEGGLAEALEGMSRGILALNPENKVSLVFPKYSHLPTNILAQMKNPTMHTDSQGEVYRVFTQEINGVCCHFIEDPLFELNAKKPKIYDIKEYQRFATFSALAADFIYETKNTDIIHLHDWHVSGVALKLKKDHPEQWANGEIPPVVFTYHNNNQSAQGRVSLGPYCYDPIVSGYVQHGILDHNDNLFIKTLEVVDQVTTVSKSFALETQQVQKGHGVSFAVKAAAKAGKLIGIINGTTPSRFNPSTDRSLVTWKTGNLSYGVNHPSILEQKQKCKSEFAKWVQTYLPDVSINSSKPWITFIGRLDSTQKGLDKFEECIEETLKNGGQFVCMGSLEDSEGAKVLDRLQKKYKDGVVFIRDHKQANGKYFYQDGDGNRPGIGSIVRAASDFLFIPSSYEPCGLIQFEGWLFGSLAIASNTGGLADTITSFDEDPNHFNGCLFERDNNGELSKIIAKSLQFWTSLSTQDKEKIIRRLMTEAKKNDWNSPSLKERTSPAQQYRIAYANAKNRLSHRKSTPASHLIETLRRKHFSPPSPADTPHAKANIQQETYLQNFYSKMQDAKLLEALYRALPDKIRSNFPHPYGIGVNYLKHEEFGAFVYQDGIRFSTRSTGSNVSIVLLNHDMTVNKEIPMNRGDDHKWEVSIPGIKEGQKYQIKTDGKPQIDPYGRRHDFHSVKDKAASVVDFGKYTWTDSKWIAKRENNAGKSVPMSVYEIHVTSWKKDALGNNLNYRQLALELANHCEKVGYTHVEMLGLLDHPREGSWGYQVGGYFSPNSRLGSVEDFKYMVDFLHKRNIGVILDWVPAHFSIHDSVPSDDFKASGVKYRFGARHIRYRFGSYHFDFTKQHVRDFMTSSAYYWAKEMHIDGLRVDCVPSLLESEEKEPTDLFLRDVNAVLHDKCRGVLSVAEDYSGDIRVTFPYYKEGFNFDMKWDVNWMKTTPNFFRSTVEARKSNYEQIQNTIMGDLLHRQVVYLSHDEANLPNGWVGNFDHLTDMNQKEANMRIFWSLMMSTPGKKLNFMGNDWGSDSAWCDMVGKTVGLQNNLNISNKRHRQLLAMISELHCLYKSNKPLYERDDNGNDIEWIEDPNKQIHAFRRQSYDGTSFACIHNFLDKPVDDFVVTIPKSKKTRLAPKEIFNSDSVGFGGEGRKNNPISVTETAEAVQYTVSLPPFTSIIISEGKVHLKKRKAVEEEGNLPTPSLLARFFKDWDQLRSWWWK